MRTLSKEEIAEVSGGFSVSIVPAFGGRGTIPIVPPFGGFPSQAPVFGPSIVPQFGGFSPIPRLF